jgi:hypothetical protein
VLLLSAQDFPAHLELPNPPPYSSGQRPPGKLHTAHRPPWLRPYPVVGQFRPGSNGLSARFVPQNYALGS